MPLALRAVFVLTLSIAATASATPSFTGLGAIPGASSGSTEAAALSGDGNAVAGIGWTGSQYVAYRWTRDGGMELLGDLPGGTTTTQPNALSYDGSVVVGYSNGANGYEAFRWTQAGGLTGLGPLSTGGSSYANGVSGDGSVLVGYANAAGVWKPVRWTQATGFETLPPDPGGAPGGAAHGVSADGSAIVGGVDGRYATLWRYDIGIIVLGELPGGGYGGGATAISADGSAVVGSSQSGNGREAFRWTEAGGMEGLGDIDSARVHYFYSEAYDVSGDGRVVVGMGYAKNYEAFVWTAAGGIQPLAKLLTQDYGLDLAGWRLTRAVGVSDDGLTFSGTGVNPSGKTEAWIATIPEPASAALVTLGCALLSAPRRRHG